MLRWAKPVIYVKSVPDIACQKLSKLANVLPSYSKNKSGTFFIDTRCIYDLYIVYWSPVFVALHLFILLLLNE